jgi:hypothetical protein
MKVWSKDQEEYTERQFQEIERRKREETPERILEKIERDRLEAQKANKREDQVRKCLELFRELALENGKKIEAGLNCYQQDDIEEVRAIFLQEQEEEKQRGMRESEEMVERAKKEAEFNMFRAR